MKMTTEVCCKYSASNVVALSIAVCLFAMIGITHSNEVCESLLVMQPSPLLQYVPINSTVTYNCKANAPHTQIHWSIDVQDSELPLNFAQFGPALNIRGIFEAVDVNPGQLPNTSIVTIEASKENNGSTVICSVTVGLSGMLCTSEKAELFVYDRPFAPRDLLATDIGVGTVNVSWEAEMWTGMEQDYTMIATSSLTQAVFTEEHIKHTHIVFTASKESPPCDVYAFRVIASNDVGDSEPSVKIERMLQSLPQNVSTVSDSLSHSVSKSSEGMSVIISFMTASSCEDYPITNYIVVLNGESREGVHVQPSIEKAIEGKANDIQKIIFDSMLDGIVEDTLYSYQVIVSNAVGNASSKTKDLYTSDVQHVTVKEDNDESLFVECEFVQGSDALGCLVVLVSDIKQVKNISQTFYRNGSELVLQGVMNTSMMELCHHLVLGYDIEADNNISTLALPGNLRVNNKSVKCPEVQANNTESLGSSRTMVIIISASVSTFIVTTIILITIIMIVFCVAVFVRKKKGNSSNSVQVTMRQRDNVYFEREKGIPFDKESSSIFESLSRGTHNSTVHHNKHDHRTDKQTAVREDPLYSRLHSGDSSLSGGHLSINTPLSEVTDTTYAQLNETPDYAFLESGTVPQAIDTQGAKEQPVYCVINDFKKAT